MPSNHLKTCQILAKWQHSKYRVLPMLHVSPLKHFTDTDDNLDLAPPPCPSPDCVHILPTDELLPNFPTLPDHKRIYRAVWNFSQQFWSCPQELLWHQNWELRNSACSTINNHWWCPCSTLQEDCGTGNKPESLGLEERNGKAEQTPRDSCHIARA